MKENKIQLVELNVNGIMCTHCQAKVQKTLESIDGVKKVVVNIESKTATVTIDEGLNPELLMAALKNEGYEPVSYNIL